MGANGRGVKNSMESKFLFTFGSESTVAQTKATYSFYLIYSPLGRCTMAQGYNTVYLMLKLAGNLVSNIPL